jgi:hypothetical protein
MKNSGFGGLRQYLFWEGVDIDVQKKGYFGNGVKTGRAAEFSAHLTLHEHYDQ